MIYQWKKGLLTTFLSISMLAPMVSPACIYAEEEVIEDTVEESDLEEIQEDDEVFVAEKELKDEIEKLEIKERENASEKEVEIMITVKDDLDLNKSKLIIKGMDVSELENPEKEENVYTFKGSFEEGTYAIDSLELLIDGEKEVIDLTTFKQHFEVEAVEEETTEEADVEEPSEETEEKENEEIKDTEETEESEEVEEEVFEVSEDDQRFLEEEEEIVQEEEAIDFSTYLNRANAFVSDARWRDGTYWPQINPKLSNGGGTGCYAYCLDFCAYVFNEYYNFDMSSYYDYGTGQWKYSNFSSFYDTSAIQSGDIVWLGYHYFVVVRREGNKLYTAEGASGIYSSTSVVVSDAHYEIRDGYLYDLWNNQYLSMYLGYRYNYMPADTGQTTPVVDPPVISNVKVSDVSATGYKVTCKVTSDIDIDHVSFPTWTVTNDQDDLPSNWDALYRGTKNTDGTYSFWVNTADHNYEDDAYYITHIYAFDSLGQAGGYFSLEYTYVPSGIQRLEGYSITLDGSIGVNFYMSFNDAVLNDEGAYMKFTLPNGTTTTRLVKDALTYTSHGYYVFPVNVSAKDMTGNIKAEFYYSNSTKPEKEFTYTVEEYANYIINHSSKFSESSVTIAKAMLTYGKYVQLYFGFNTSHLATKVNTLSTPDLSEFKSQIIDQNDTLDFVGAHLTLTSTPELKLYFNEDANFRLNGKRVTATQSGKYYVITISDINDMEEMFTITANNFLIEYGIFSYGYQALTNSSNVDLQNMIKAMYAFDMVTH